uniref:Ribonuclease E n=4 Tax=unclassified bacterial viruses TaxID=12333 RepID=A0AAU6W1X2_9VIRU
MKANPSAKAPEFTERQIEYLERMYPEITGDASTSHETFLVQSGKRTVVRHLRSLLTKETH